MNSAKINFIVVGAQKAGTTALRMALSNHPNILLPRGREGHLFDRPSIYYFAPAFLREKYYGYRFPRPPKQQSLIKGEFTPSYLHWEKAPYRIAQHNPNVLLIAILRNPVDRAYSHYSMERRRGWETIPTFEEAVDKELEGLHLSPDRQHRVRSYVQRGFYAEQLSRYFSVFSKDQLMVLRYEDWSDHPSSVLSKLCDFLNIARLEMPSERVFVGTYNRMKEETRKRLQDLFLNDIRKTSLLTGLDLSAWTG